MQVRNAILSVASAVLIGVLVYLDRSRWLYDVPLLALVVGATLVSVQELTRMAARKDLQLPISAMNLSGVLVCLFVYYFREPAPAEPFRPPQGTPEPLLRQAELAMSLLLAILALVLTTTLITYATTRRRAAVRELLIGIGGTVYLAGGLSYALLLEYLPRQVEPLRDGLLTVVALLAAVWLGEGAAGWVDRFFAPLEPAAEPPSEPSPSSPPGKPEVEAALSGRPASRKSRRARGKRRKARDSAPSSEPTRARDRSLWTSALTAAGVFVGVILFRNWLGLETREALLGGLAVGGVILVRRLFRRAFQRPVPASREDPWGGAGSASLSAPLRPSPTLAGAVAAVVGTVLVFDLLGERCLGLNTPQALLTGLAMGLAARASGRILYAVKRFFEARYTGSLLPGYGGLLDHLGSLFLALPAAYYCLRWLL